MVLKKIKLRKKFIILGLVAALVVGGFFLRQKLIKSKNGPLETAQIQKGTVQEELVLSGEIDAREHVVLQFPTSGLLTWVGVKEGDTVKKHQAIASLDSRQLKKTLEKYLNTYGKTRNSFEQTQDTNRNWELTPDAENRQALERIIANSQLDLNSAVLDVELQDLAVRLATLTTPIAGVVTTVTDPFAGVNIFATQTKFEVVNPATIFFKVAADQSEVVSLSEGQAVKIVLDSFSDQTLEGKIKSIAYSPETGEVGTIYKIEVEFQNPDFTGKTIRLGMTGDASFVLSQKEEVLYIPNEFLNSDSEGKYLYLGKAGNKVYVETGLEGEEFTEVSGAINEGDTVYNQ